MTAAAPRSPEPYEVPEGGLASFLTATVGDWSDEALNADNYYDIVKPTADQLAEFGREEDDRIAHVATGETIIPMAVFEEDPELKEALFTRMREMGIDPERYIVGNELNSINPVTGQPEFFLKKIFKGVKKAVKGVVKVFKKVAPIILSTVGFMVAGPLGASLGSGIGTLIQGGNLKDAFKSALIAGATAGITQGIGQGFGAAGQTTGGFGAKLSAGVKGFGESISSGLSGGYVDQFTQGVANITGQSAAQAATNQPALTAADAVQQGAAPAGGIPTNVDMTPPISGGPTNLNMTGPTNLNMAGYQGTPLADNAVSSALGIKPVAQQAGRIPTNLNMAGYQGTPLADDAVSSALGIKPVAQQGVGTTPAASATSVSDIPDLQGTGSSDPGGINFDAASGAAKQAADKTFFQRFSDFMTGADPSQQKILELAREKIQLQESILGIDATPEMINKAIEQATKELSPGLLRTYGPSALALTGIGAAAGFFDQPEMEPLPDAFGGMTGQKLIDMYPSQYTLSAPGAYIAPSMAAADGGGIDTSKFPRRNGKISGPGTETSDDIPAMLSDGEFVMTAKAVRGAGNGSREAGMRNMYNMMSRFEGNA